MHLEWGIVICVQIITLDRNEQRHYIKGELNHFTTKGGMICVSQQLKEATRVRLDSVWTKMMDDDRRRDVVFVCFVWIMGSVSGFMTIVNIFTQKWLLMGATLIFFLACMANIWLSRHGRQQLAETVFLTEAIVLCGFFAFPEHRRASAPCGHALSPRSL